MVASGDGFGFSWAVGPTQGEIAVREATKAFDHRLVIKRIFEQIGVTQAAYQPYRFALVFAVFAVLKGQIEEQSFVFAQADIVAQLNRRAADCQRQMVGGKGFCCPAMHIARYLIEQDVRSKCGFGVG